MASKNGPLDGPKRKLGERVQHFTFTPLRYAMDGRKSHLSSTPGKAMAVASKTLKITHLDLARESFDTSWARLGASGAEAWARFRAPERFGTGRLGCWHHLVAGFCLVRAHQKLQPSNQGTEFV